MSHDVRETAEIADYIYVISQGRVMEQGPPNRLLDSSSAWVRQFMHGLPDGPVRFHYPGPALEQDLFGGA